MNDGIVMSSDKTIAEHLRTMLIDAQLLGRLKISEDLAPKVRAVVAYKDKVMEGMTAVYGGDWQAFADYTAVAEKLREIAGADATFREAGEVIGAMDYRAICLIAALAADDAGMLERNFRDSGLMNELQDSSDWSSLREQLIDAAMDFSDAQLDEGVKLTLLGEELMGVLAGISSQRIEEMEEARLGR